MHSVCLWNDFNTTQRMESDEYDDYTNYPHLKKSYVYKLKANESFTNPKLRSANSSCPGRSLV